mmetsp:Transcript_7772/g.31491  ORF Transcript_7772/g.31491 Transcript_7772/m.31491 type:complete len:205 (-) Transcript_7772:1508-2122(-)
MHNVILARARAHASTSMDSSMESSKSGLDPFISNPAGVVVGAGLSTGLFSFPVSVSSPAATTIFFASITGLTAASAAVTASLAARAASLSLATSAAAAASAAALSTAGSTPPPTPPLLAPSDGIGAGAGGAGLAAWAAACAASPRPASPLATTQSTSLQMPRSLLPTEPAGTRSMADSTAFGEGKTGPTPAWITETRGANAPLG